ncbi:hypothetical protein [Paenibacillus apiarius]|uniref:hypothetical protein n=1 Tax=Paenibacillus apiarius TaxID=46240 RepID=UPI003B3BD332
MNLNEKVMEYKRTGSQDLFGEIYREVSRPWAAYLQRDSSYAMTDYAEVSATYDDKLLDVIDKFDPQKGNFISILSSALANARTDLRRKNLRRRRMEIYASSEEDAATFLERDDVNVNVERTALTYTKKKEQRQLLSHLVAEADDLTHKIVILFAENDSFNAVGKQLGIDHKRVKRRIESLSRRYDGNRFGDIRDILYA